MLRRVVLAALLGLAALPALAWERTETLVHDGVTRSYVLHVPDHLPPGRHALVLVFHGGGGNAENAARMSGMSAIADREGFIVAYPNGSGRLQNRLLTWNVGNCCGYALDHRVDDTGFIRALIEKLEATQPVDARRVYATGMSNGGMMAYRVGCELADKVAAIAPVAGALAGECRPVAPVSVIAFHGTADQHVRYEGGAPVRKADTHPRSDRAVRDTLGFWVEQDRCARHETFSAAPAVAVDAWSRCRGNAAVQLYTLQGFGHAWPGGQRGSWLGDSPEAAVSASEVMWRFFSEHPKP